MKRFIAFLILGVAAVSAAPPATYVPRSIKELDDARGVSLSLKFVPMWDGTKFTPRFVLQSDVTNLVTALAGKEPALGNPGVDGYVLASTILGERSWVVPGTGPQGPPGATGAAGATGATGAAGSDAVASDTAYDATSWNGVTTIAPSKNAVRDKFETLGTLSTQSGTFSGTSSGTNTGDNAVNSLYSGLVSNATHTGDVTGATALTLATAQPAVHTWALAQTLTVAPVFSDQSGTRTALGLGTLATQSGTFSGTSSGTNTGDNPPSDTAYDATSWDGVTTVAPSKNAVRDKIESLGGGGGTWGTITGTLSDQTDLQSALNLKYNKSHIPVTLNLISGDNTGELQDSGIDPAPLTTWAGITPGTGVVTALAVDVGTSGAFVTNGGALGTPSSGTGTNLTGIPESGVTNLTSDLALKAPLASPTFTGAVTTPNITLSGNQSAAAWTTSGLRLVGVAGTLTDTTSSGTVSAAYTNKLGGNTIAASSATTFTNYISGYFSDPVAGTNVTMTNKYALGADSLRVGTSNALSVSNAGILTLAVAPVFTDQSGTRTALGLGTLATQSGTFSGTSSGTNTGDQTNITGNAATVTTNANLTGHVTSTGNAAVLGSFTFAQLNTAISDADTARTDAANSFTGVQTFSNQILDSYTSTASTPAIYATGSWLTGGTGTTNFPHFLLQATGTTASTTWSTAGTGIGVNAVTGFTGNLIDLKLAGTSNFKVTSAGGIVATGSITGVTSIGASQQISLSSGNAQIYGPADKVIRLSNSAGAGPTRINITNDSNSFPSFTADLVNGFTFTSAAGTTTWNDPSTASSGTVANRYLLGIAAPTLTATNATVTDTVASTVYIGGAPTASTNTTIGTPYALNVAAGVVKFGGGTVILPGYTVATLPSTAATGKVAGAMAYVTDATAPTYNGTLTGSGAVVVPVFCDGTNWTSH